MTQLLRSFSLLHAMRPWLRTLPFATIGTPSFPGQRRSFTSNVRAEALIPFVVEQTARGERSYDIFS
ncbi:hypothetical protein IWQ61_010608, partial [Dispira simplex]